jgi:CRP-like cAMP-binding protein
MGPNDEVKFLKTVKIFELLTDEELVVLSQLFTSHQCRTNERIVSEGEMSSKFYVVREGFVNVTRGQTPKEKEEGNAFVTVLGAGDYFGEAALFHDVKRIANVDAADKTRLLVVDKKDFERYLHANPIAANRILILMFKQLFLRLEKTLSELQFERSGGLAQSAIDQLFG